MKKISIVLTPEVKLLLDKGKMFFNEYSQEKIIKKLIEAGWNTIETNQHLSHNNALKKEDDEI